MEDQRSSKYDSTDAQTVSSVRNSRKIRKTLGKMAWPFQISIDLGGEEKPKVAFWSGEERKYYPENPGHSKLAQVFVASSLKGDAPGPTYDPPPIGVRKPISRAGYGIGGLLSARFQKALGENERRPEPGTYQTVDVCPPPQDASQLEVAFGSGLALPRFGQGSSLKPPGPGSYNVIGKGHGCRELKHQSAFGSRRCIEPTTVTICSYMKGEVCTVCGQEQLFDYYRTKAKVKHPDAKRPDRPETVVLCRKCYCQAWNGHHAHWTLKNLTWLFQKCRHCSYVHEHRSLPLIINKARVRDIKRLTAKESLLAKYFSDHCQPEIKK